jgi:hypothetical protein
MKTCFRSSVYVCKAGIDAGGLKLEAGIFNSTLGSILGLMLCTKISEYQASKDKLRYERRQQHPSIESN